jgi:hypothetical protein
MKPDLCSSYVEGLMAVLTVDPGELFRTVRWQGAMLAAVHGSPSPCPRS